jgi:hypothetical protein
MQAKSLPSKSDLKKGRKVKSQSRTSARNLLEPKPVETCNVNNVATVSPKLTKSEEESIAAFSVMELSLLPGLSFV